VILVALAAWCVHLGVDASARVTRRSCARPVAVDGFLRCDEEGPPTIGALCGTDHRAAHEELRAGDRIDTALLCGGDPAGRTRMAAADLRRLQVPIDPNRAGLDELRSLPGIGPVLAERIVAGRPYASSDDLLRVRGIGPKTLEKLRSRLTLR